MMRLMFLVAAVLVPSVSLQADDWGSIRGQIVVEGEIPRVPKRNAVPRANVLFGFFAEFRGRALN